MRKSHIVKSGAARRIAGAVIRGDPEYARRQLGPVLERHRYFRDAAVPNHVEGFQDLDFLVSSNRLNQGIILLTLREATHVWRLATRVSDGTIVEIGRFKGGSTLLLAAAMGIGTTLHSYDLHAKLTSLYDFDQLDRELEAALRTIGKGDRVHLHVGDSKTVPFPAPSFNLVFIDGDHSYLGAKADFDRWKQLLAPNGSIVFHDGNVGDFIGGDPEVARVVADAELEGWERVAAVDTIVELRRREP